jgi:hypothetical protein
MRVGQIAHLLAHVGTHVQDLVHDQVRLAVPWLP